MRKGIQDLMYVMGTDGCLVFALIQYCKEQFGWNGDVISAICEAVDRGIVAYNPNDKRDPIGGTVMSSLDFIKLLTGLNVKEKRIEVSGFVKMAVPHKINFWQLPNASLGVGHFTYGEWCSLENSNTVKNGYLKQVRTYEVIK